LLGSHEKVHFGEEREFVSCVSFVVAAQFASNGSNEEWMQLGKSRLKLLVTEEVEDKCRGYCFAKDKQQSTRGGLDNPDSLFE